MKHIRYQLYQQKLEKQTQITISNLKTLIEQLNRDRIAHIFLAKHPKKRKSERQ